MAVAAAAAAAAAAATTKAREDMDEGARRAGVASVGCGVWANLGCLQHEHGKRGAARRSYLNALEADSMQYEAGLDPEVKEGADGSACCCLSCKCSRKNIFSFC